MKNSSQELRDLQEKYLILKEVNGLLQKQLRQRRNTADACIQVEMPNLEIKQLIASIEHAHQEERRTLQHQVECLEKKIKVLKSRMLIKSIHEIRSIYLNKLPQPKLIQEALVELEHCISQKKEYEIQDLKFKLHQAEMAIRQPMPIVRQFSIDKLQKSIRVCQETSQCTEDLDLLMQQLDEADSQWNDIYKELTAEQSTIENGLQTAFNSLTYEISQIGM